MARPTSEINWMGAAIPDTIDLIEPSAGKKAAGWNLVEKPPHQYMNWVLWNLAKWQEFTDAQVSANHTDLGVHPDFQFGGQAGKGQAFSTGVTSGIAFNCEWDQGNTEFTAANADNTKPASILEWNNTDGKIYSKRKTTTSSPWTTWDTTHTFNAASGAIDFDTTIDLITFNTTTAERIYGPDHTGALPLTSPATIAPLGTHIEPSAADGNTDVAFIGINLPQGATVTVLELHCITGSDSNDFVILELIRKDASTATETVMASVTIAAASGYSSNTDSTISSPVIVTGYTYSLKVQLRAHGGGVPADAKFHQARITFTMDNFKSSV
jgi:hypothetical protein